MSQLTLPRGRNQRVQAAILEAISLGRHCSFSIVGPFTGSPVTTTLCVLPHFHRTGARRPDDVDHDMSSRMIRSSRTVFGLRHDPLLRTRWHWSRSLWARLVTLTIVALWPPRSASSTSSSASATVICVRLATYRSWMVMMRRVMPPTPGNTPESSGSRSAGEAGGSSHRSRRHLLSLPKTRSS